MHPVRCRIGTASCPFIPPSKRRENPWLEPRPARVAHVARPHNPTRSNLRRAAGGEGSDGGDASAAGPAEAPPPTAEEVKALLLSRPAIVLAGFPLEELPLVRTNLDAAGGQEVALIPCVPELLWQPAEYALRCSEPAWDQPVPSQWVDGGGWGQRRVVMFSGLL